MIVDIDPAALEPRTLLDGQRCEIRVHDVATGTSRVVFETDQTLFEAPNWTDDGRLVVNGEGVLWTLDVDGGVGPAEPVTARRASGVTSEHRGNPAVPSRVRIDGVPGLNNDHVLSPVDDTVFVSANDFHIYQAPLAGGTARQVTLDEDALHFLHGVSPDGRTLAYVRVSPDGWGDVRVHLVDVDGSNDRAVTSHPGPADGSEFTPDGSWIYLNTEQFTPGQAQIARIRPDGSGLARLTFTDRVDWFPHVAPVGTLAVYLSFPGGTVGHPADHLVQLMLVSDYTSDLAWASPTVLATFNGGQGTINVNSWSPDGRAFAYVAYPLA